MIKDIMMKDPITQKSPRTQLAAARIFIEHNDVEGIPIVDNEKIF